MKANLLLELGEFLYNHNCSKVEGRQLVQWAVDILLQEHEHVNEAGTLRYCVTHVFMHQELNNSSSARSKAICSGIHLKA